MDLIRGAIETLRPGVDFADTNGTLVGIRWDTPDVTPPSQAEVDAEVARIPKLAAIDTAFAAAIDAGLAFGGKVIQIDDSGRANIAAAATRAGFVLLAVPGMTWPAGFVWRCADNSALSLDAASMLAMGQAAGDRFTFLVLHRGALRDALAAAATAEQVDAIAVTADW